MRVVDAGEERRGRRQRPRLELGAARAPLGRVDEVADRELVVGELGVGHLDVVGEELVADLLEAVGLEAARITDLRVARRQRVALQRLVQPVAELGNVDHLADEVVVVEADPTAGPQHPVQLGEERVLVEPVHARATRGRAERRRHERHPLRAAEQVAARRGARRAARSISGDRSTPTTVAACAASATVDIPVPHAMSRARSTVRVADDRDDALERARMVERPAAVVVHADARRPRTGSRRAQAAAGVTEVFLPRAEARVRAAGRVALAGAVGEQPERPLLARGRRPRSPCSARRRRPRARRATAGTGRCGACTRRGRRRSRRRARAARAAPRPSARPGSGSTRCGVAGSSAVDQS